jgi:hypothetical protein
VSADARVARDAQPATAVRVFVSFLVARAAFGLAYIGAAVGGLPVPWYAPMEHTWRVATTPSGRAMGWFGLTATALVAAAILGSLTYLAGARGAIGRALARTSIVVAIAHAGALVLLVDFAYFGWTLTHQSATPWQDPACPR